MSSPPPVEATERKGLALLLLAAAQFVVVLDASIVNVALPSIGRALDFSEENLSWVVNAYTLVFGGFLLLGGRLADLIGRRRLFVVGLGIFAVASLLGGLSQSDGQLIAARALQGLGAALLSPAALSILTTTFAEGAERNRALGVWGAVAGSGGAVGVLLGGVLTEFLGWEWVLFVNVPVGLLVAFGALRVLPESRAEGERQLDVLGALTITAGLSLVVFSLVRAPEEGWGSARTLGLLGGGLALVAVFVAVERVWPRPLVPFRIFRNRTLTGANLTALFVAMSLFSMFFFVSLYLQNVLRFSALEAGLAYLPLAAGIIVSAGGASVLVTKVGFKPVLSAGLVCVAVGLAWFSQVDPDGSFVADVLGPSLVAAVGLGLSFVPLTIAAVSGVEGNDAGLASGLINTAQQVGGALGLAILVSISNSRTGDLVGRGEALPTGQPNALAATEGFQSAFLVGAALALAGALVAALVIRSRDSRAHRDAAQAGETAPVAA